MKTRKRGKCTIIKLNKTVSKCERMTTETVQF